MTRHHSKLITWSKTFACGIKIIDDQHKDLVNLVNDMHNHITGNEEQEREYFDMVIGEAEKYIKIHFDTEEKIMAAANFTGLAEHKKAHDNFIATVEKYVSDYSAGKRLSLYSFTQSLKDWALSHIAVLDKQYFVHLQKIAARKTHGKLKVS